MKSKQPDPTPIWQRYERGVDHHNRTGLYSRTQKAHRFFIGEQWYGLTGDGLSLPVMNIIQPTIEYKVATVAQNSVRMCFSPQGESDSRALELKVCERLGEFAARRWEHLKMDDVCWRVVKDACIAGAGYLYFYNGQADCQVLDTTDVYFGDEQSEDIQSQPYIIIYERRSVARLKKEALENGLSPEQCSLITPDDDVEHQIGQDGRAEVGGDESKCSCLLMLERGEDGYIHVTRSTRAVVYRPDTPLTVLDAGGAPVGGLTRYPLAGFVWMQKKGSARGIGEATQMTANQIEINRTLARRALAVKSFAFPKLIYDRGRVENPDALAQTGASIAVDNLNGNPVDGLITYLNPAPISASAETLTGELIATTRDLAGAGDSATGMIDPEKASGAAIIAVRDMAQIPLNEQISAFRRFVEDVAGIWYELWCVYNPQGLRVDLPDGTAVTLPAQVLRAMRPFIRVDVSSGSPYSKYASQQAVEALFSSGAITLEELVGLLDDDSALPRAKLEELLRSRAAAAADAGAGTDIFAPRRVKTERGQDYGRKL